MPYVWVFPRGRPTLVCFVSRGARPLSDPGASNGVWPFVAPRTPNRPATEKQSVFPTGFTLHKYCHPGHEGTAAFSTNQGKWLTQCRKFGCVSDTPTVTDLQNEYNGPRTRRWVRFLS